MFDAFYNFYFLKSDEWVCLGSGCCLDTKISQIDLCHSFMSYASQLFFNVRCELLSHTAIVLFYITAYLPLSYCVVFLMCTDSLLIYGILLLGSLTDV